MSEPPKVVNYQLKANDWTLGETAAAETAIAALTPLTAEQRTRTLTAAKVLLGLKSPRRRQPRIRTPDGLLTRAEAAAKLGCSAKTLDGHVECGALRYVAIGHGRKRVRRMFTTADLDEFIAAQTRKDVPCPSTRIRARHTGNLTSDGEVIAFTAQPRPRAGAKPKK
jgi:hypothetical protein